MDKKIAIAPSTNWREVIPSDEEQRLRGYIPAFQAMQQERSKRFGTGRALHRKQLLGARAELEVLANLPVFAAQGLFAKPARYKGCVRLSNGGMDKAADRTPDVRGFGLAVEGVKGDSALGNGAALSQCFVLINHSQFSFEKATDFIEFVLAAAHGPAALLKHLVKKFGLVAGARRLLQTVKGIKKPFSGFANENFYSAAPIACGPYAVRVRLVPDAANGQPDPHASSDWGADLAKRLVQGPLRYQLELQPFVDESITPIENATVDWPTPYTAVAILTLPKQDIAADAELSSVVENGIFDPWAALAAHRPLGNVMRARKVMYFESQKGRKTGA